MLELNLKTPEIKTISKLEVESIAVNFKGKVLVVNTETFDNEGNLHKRKCNDWRDAEFTVKLELNAEGTTYQEVFENFAKVLASEKYDVV